MEADEVDDSEAIEDGAEEDVTLQSLVTAFQQFMEGATIGQYAARLRMLLAFHCQMSMMESPSKEEGEILFKCVSFIKCCFFSYINSQLPIYHNM